MPRSKKRKQEDTDAITIHKPPRKENKRLKAEQEREDVYSASSAEPKDIEESFDALGNILSDLIRACNCTEVTGRLEEEEANLITTLKRLHSDQSVPWLNKYLGHKGREGEDKASPPSRWPAASSSAGNTPLSQKISPPVQGGQTPPPGSSANESPEWPPPLPPINNKNLYQQAFTHKSFIKGEDAGLPGTEQMHYERLEFLGDSYLQSITSHILYDRFPRQREGPLSAMRQQLVANRPLSIYATIYKFHDHIREAKGQNNALPVAIEPGSHGATKDTGVNKTLADCFEAYIAAIVLDSPNGTEIAQQWLEALFEPKLKEMEAQHTSIGSVDKMAKQTLNSIVGGNRAVVEYVWTGGQGGNKGGYWITVYLTGWGFTKREIGTGWGTNKGEAALRAAMNCIANKEFCNEMSALKTKFLGPRPFPQTPVSGSSFFKKFSPTTFGTPETPASSGVAGGVGPFHTGGSEPSGKLNVTPNLRTGAWPSPAAEVP